MSVNCKLKYPIKRKFSKRFFDIVFSLFLIIFLSPIYLLISFLILITSPGPIFYFSKRIGQGGKIIKCIKFRTMYVDAEKKLHELLKTNTKYKLEWEKFQKLKNDPRITTIGLFLRKTSLDELPQFFNVIKGDLSIVGPRPFVLVGPSDNFHIEIKKYLGDKTAKILSIKPGITGVWQTTGRSELSIEKRVQLEEKYIDQQSFFKDLVLIIKTIWVIFFPNGAY